MSRIPPKPVVREGNVQRRVVGSSPELGKFGRVSTEPKRRRKSKSGKGTGSSRRRRRSTSRILSNWLILILSVTGLILGSMLLWSAFNQNKPSDLPPLHGGKTPPLFSDQALSMAKEMLAATDPAEIEALIRPGTLSPEQALDIIRGLREGEPTPLRTYWMGSVDSLSVPIELVSVRFKNSYPRPILFVLDSEGDWKLDFDAFAGHCEPSYESFLEQEAEEGLLRIYAKQDTYYNERFGDESEWSCYELSHPSSKMTLYGYTRIGTAADDAMEAIHHRTTRHKNTVEEERPNVLPRRKTDKSRTTLVVKKLPNARERQFEITNVISDDWVITDKLFEVRVAEFRKTGSLVQEQGN